MMKEHEEVMDTKTTRLLLDPFERLWLRWNRSRAHGILEFYEHEAKEHKRLSVEARAVYQFWVDRERFRGISNYDDRDITWKYETWVYGGCVAITVLWFLFFVWPSKSLLS